MAEMAIAHPTASYMRIGPRVDALDIPIKWGLPRIGKKAAPWTSSPSEKHVVFNKKRAFRKGAGAAIAARFPDHFTGSPGRARQPAYSYALWLFGTIAKGGPISV
jgi:hypothetical protein